MITPADLAHMLGQTPNAAGNHTQDQLLYTSQTPRNSADLEVSVTATAGETVTPSRPDNKASSNKAPQSNEPLAPAVPTPATVFGMKATVTIATPNETIQGQTDGIAAEAGTETMTNIATPATVFGKAVKATPSTVAAQTTHPGDGSVSGPTRPIHEPDEKTARANGRPTAGTQVNAANSNSTANTNGVQQHHAAPPIMSAAAAMRAIAAVTMRVETRPELGSETSESTTAPSPTRIASTGPTPAIMPQRRTSEGPTTFASLDAQELPVVREYSAGGLIFDDQNRVAIIARHSRSGHLEWCLPKGHIEKGETPQQTAVREVHEETGILGEVIDSIATIDYWFTGTTQRVHKLVHHFALRQTGGELTVEGDPDHEAEDAIWVRFDDLDDVLSYPNERKIAWLYARKKNRQANE
ncbi:NUDIX hydrolase [Bifidobacterium felsineum]|nr:NUDIX domain-containing protein [Bifidobacterium felsineum]MBT1163028.1 NUDIX domain-containing protein [Bifidobacterium felsineum]